MRCVAFFSPCPVPAGVALTAASSTKIWLSITPALGPASQPAFSRAAIANSWLILASRPERERSQKYPRTVEYVGKSFGSWRHHWHRVAALSWIASITARNSVVRYWPDRDDAGMNGATSAHSTSVKSLA